MEKGGEKKERRKERAGWVCVVCKEGGGGGITDWTVPLEWGNQLFKDQTDLKFSMTGCIIHQDGFISKKQSRLQAHSPELSSEGILKHHPPPSSKHPLICRWLSLRHVCSQTLQAAAVTRLLHYTFSLWFYLLLFGKNINWTQLWPMKNTFRTPLNHLTYAHPDFKISTSDSSLRSL